MQQGRVQLDADWNAMMDIVTYNHQVAIRNIVGDCSVPRENAGFRIFKRNSLKFNGSSNYLNLGPIFPFLLDNDFIIEAWVCPRLGGGGGTILSRFDIDDKNNYKGEYRLWIKPSGTLVFQRLEWAESDQLVSHSTSHEPLDSERPRRIHLRSLEAIKAVEFGHFIHIAIVSIGAALYLYLDYTPVAHADHVNLGVDAPDLPLLVGAQLSYGKPAHFFDGYISEIQISEIINVQQIEQSSSRPEFNQLQTQSTQSLLRTQDNISTGLNGDSLEHTSYPSLIYPPLFIEHGVGYTAGILCENEADSPLIDQPNLPVSALPAVATLSGLYLVYLDVWFRYISEIADPFIREVALGGASTTGRSKLIWQVKLLPLADYPERDWMAAFKGLVESDRYRGWLKARHRAEIELTGNYLYRLEIHNPGLLYGTHLAADVPIPILKVQLIEVIRVQVIEGDLSVWEVGQWVEIGIETHQYGLRILTKISEIDVFNNCITFTEVEIGFSIETILYVRPIATLKWSRENGSIIYPINRVESEHSLTIANLPPGQPALKTGDWVEIVDDDYVLADQVQHLCQIQSLEQTSNLASTRITLNPSLPAHVGRDPAKHPLLRRWDQTAAHWIDDTDQSMGQPSKLVDGVIPLQKGWLTIEEGIEVEFEEEGIYQKRQYWWIVARTITQKIEWPLDHDSQPIFQPPQGIDHNYMPLSLIDFRDQQIEIIQDLRTIAIRDDQWLGQYGDTVSAEPEIERDLSVEEDVTLQVEEDVTLQQDVTVGKLHGAMAPSLVDSTQVVDDAITVNKLANDIGLVPPGHCILGPTALAPSDYTYTGRSISVSETKHFYWQTVSLALPSPGQVYTAVIRDSIYCLWETGHLWEFQPHNDAQPWTQLTSMPGPKRKAFAVGVLHGKLYAMGGYLSEGADIGQKTGLNYEYDPASDTWNTNRAPVPTPRSHLGVGVVDNKLYAIGGQISCLWGLIQNVITGVNEVYDPRTNRWSHATPLSRARSAFGMVSYQGALYVFGGQRKRLFRLWCKQKVAWTDAYSPLRRRWLQQTPMPTAISHLGVAEIADQFYVIGGKNAQRQQDRTFVYDPQIRIWRQGPPLQRAKKSPGTVAVEGSIYILGGITPLEKTKEIQKMTIQTMFYLHQKQL